MSRSQDRVDKLAAALREETRQAGTGAAARRASAVANAAARNATPAEVQAALEDVVYGRQPDPDPGAQD